MKHLFFIFLSSLSAFFAGAQTALDLELLKLYRMQGKSDSIELYLLDTGGYSLNGIYAHLDRVERQHKSIANTYSLYRDLRVKSNQEDSSQAKILDKYGNALYEALQSKLTDAAKFCNLSVTLNIPFVAHPLDGKNGWKTFVQNGQTEQARKALSSDTLWIKLQLNLVRQTPEFWSFRASFEVPQKQAQPWTYLSFELNPECYHANRPCSSYRLWLQPKPSYSLVGSMQEYKRYSVLFFDLNFQNRVPSLTVKSKSDAPLGYFVEESLIEFNFKESKVLKSFVLELPTSAQIDRYLAQANQQLLEQPFARHLIKTK